MQQPTVVVIPWLLVAFGLILAMVLTALTVVFFIQAIRARRRSKEEIAEARAFKEKKKRAEVKPCPRCGEIVPSTARFCNDCGKAL